MKGIVFNLLQEVVSRQYGEDVWDDLLDKAGASGAYTSLGNYPDTEILALVTAASNRTGLPEGEVLRWFGRQAMPILAESYPDLFSAHASSRPFVNGVNSVIHAEVRKLYPGAECPHFRMREDDDGALVMEYLSSRKLCALAQGFVEGAADFYGETVDFRHDQCVHRGDARCTFTITWLSQARRAA